ncbi:hypothetical protein ACHAQH_008288 [Verticillium albo-atrum]
MSQPSHWLSLFASEATILRLLNDWFERVHALAPVLVRRRFMRRVQSREADHNATFCGLVISVCVATSATLRREDYGDATAERGAAFIQHHRLLDHDSSNENAYTLDWCIAMYNLGTAAGSIAATGLKSTSSYHTISMSAAGVRYLAYYCIKELDFVEQQQVKRLFWLIFAGTQSGDSFGMLTPNLVSHQENCPQLRPLPLADNELDPPSQGLDPLSPGETSWHGDHTTYIPGLLRLNDIFWVWHEAQTIPVATLGGADAALKRYLAQVQQVIDSLPPELRWRGGLSRPAHITEGHDAQVVNIFITSLHIRSNLLEKFGSTPGSHEEHQRIVDDLLEILYHLPQAVFDANGSSLVPKIRDIGAAYLEQVQTFQGMGDDVKEKMDRLSRKLHDLDCWPGHPTGY